MSEFSQVPGHNVNVQKLVYFYRVATNKYTFKLSRKHHLQWHEDYEILKDKFDQKYTKIVC